MASVISKKTLGELEEKGNTYFTYSSNVCLKEGTKVHAIG